MLLFHTWLFAMLTAFLNGFKVIFIAFTSSVNEFLAALRRDVVEISREKCPAVTRLGRLTAAIGAFELMTRGVNEGYFAIIARIGHADGIRMEGTAGVQALISANGRLDTWIGANRPQGSLFEDSTVG